MVPPKPPTHLLCALLGLAAGITGAYCPVRAAGESGASPEEIRALVASLGDPDWRTRESAHRLLSQLGEAALPALREGARSADPERALRAKELLASLDPFEVAVTLVRVAIPPEDPRRWRITEKVLLQGTEDRYAAPLSIYGMHARRGSGDEVRFDVTIAVSASATPVACDLSRFRPETWLPVEERMELALWQDGVALEAEHLPSVLLLWAVTGRRSHLAERRPGVDLGKPPEELREDLTQELLRQLASSACPRDARLTAGMVLSRLGEERAREALAPFSGDPAADTALARLGDASATARLATFVASEETAPEALEAALALAEGGSVPGVRLLWRRMAEYKRETFPRCACAVARRLLGENGAAYLAGAEPFLDAVIDQPYQSWHSTLRYLLRAVAHTERGARELLLPRIKQALTGPPVTATATHTGSLLYVLRVILARHALPAADIRALGEIVAPHALGNSWQETALLLPYLAAGGGEEALEPLVRKLEEALAGETPAWNLRHQLTSVALALPGTGGLRDRFVHALAEKLDPKEGAVADKAAPRLSTQAATIIEALCVLLRVPRTRVTPAAIDRLRALAAGEPIPPGEHGDGDGAAPPAYEFFLWHVRRDGESVKPDSHGYSLVPALEPIAYRDAHGNLRILYLAPGVAATPVLPGVRHPPTARQIQRRVDILSPGGWRRSVPLELPTFEHGLFPDARVRTLWQSSVFPGDRYRTPPPERPIFLRPVVYVRPRQDTPGDLTWEQFIAGAVKELAASDPPNARVRLGFFSDLAITEAVPVLKGLLRREPSPDTAYHLAKLGDPAGVTHLTELLDAPGRHERILALRHLLSLDPSHRAAIETLIELAPASTTADLYQVASSARRVLGGACDSELRRRLLAALAAALTESSASHIIPCLRAATGLDFGYTTARSANGKAERAAKLRAVIAAWRRALAPDQTDKGKAGPPAPR
jgi:hypothetical protein